MKRGREFDEELNSREEGLELERCKPKKLVFLDERRRAREKKVETEKSKLRREKSYCGDERLKKRQTGA